MQKENILTKIDVNLMASVRNIAIFIVLASAIPAFIHAQWATGPIINAILFLSVIYCGLSDAILVGIIPSVIALSVGLLPAPLAVAVPYIMVSNAIMAITFAAFYNREKNKNNFWIGAGFGALLKFGFLFMITSTVVKFASPQIASKIAIMLSWPQLATALIGGIIAWGILKGSNYVKIKKVS